MAREHPLIKGSRAAGGEDGWLWVGPDRSNSDSLQCELTALAAGGSQWVGGGRGMTVLTLRGGEKDARLPAEQINPSAPLLPTSPLESGLLDKVGVTSFSLLITLKHPFSCWRTSNFHKGSLWVFFFFFYWWALITVRRVFHFSLLICQKQSMALFSCWSWIDWLI